MSRLILSMFGPRLGRSVVWSVAVTVFSCFLASVAIAGEFLQQGDNVKTPVTSNLPVINLGSGGTSGGGQPSTPSESGATTSSPSGSSATPPTTTGTSVTTTPSESSATTSTATGTSATTSTTSASTDDRATEQNERNRRLEIGAGQAGLTSSDRARTRLGYGNVVSPQGGTRPKQRDQDRQNLSDQIGRIGKIIREMRERERSKTPTENDPSALTNLDEACSYYDPYINSLVEPDQEGRRTAKRTNDEGTHWYLLCRQQRNAQKDSEVDRVVDELQPYGPEPLPNKTPETETARTENTPSGKAGSIEAPEYIYSLEEESIGLSGLDKNELLQAYGNAYRNYLEALEAFNRQQRKLVKRTKALRTTRDQQIVSPAQGQWIQHQYHEAFEAFYAADDRLDEADDAIDAIEDAYVRHGGKYGDLDRARQDVREQNKRPAGSESEPSTEAEVDHVTDELQPFVVGAPPAPKEIKPGTEAPVNEPEADVDRVADELQPYGFDPDPYEKPETGAVPVKNRPVRIQLPSTHDVDVRVDVR